MAERPRYTAIKTDILEQLCYLPALARAHWQFFRYRKARLAHGQEKQLVVSLTSFPDRFPKLHNCIKSIVGQTIKPDRIVLYLTEEECSGISIPDTLDKLKKYGLEIRYTKTNFRSLNKIVHALADFPDDIIVTCDDDKLYPPNWLGGLVEAHAANPDDIICWRSRTMTQDEEGQLTPYRDWPLTKDTLPSHAVLPLGVGGVLYPPHSFSDEVLDTSLFKSLCPTADDLWLKFAAIRKATMARQIDNNAVVHASIPFWNGQKLSVGNIWGQQNDLSLKRLMDHFDLDASDFIDKATNHASRH